MKGFQQFAATALLLAIAPAHAQTQAQYNSYANPYLNPYAPAPANGTFGVNGSFGANGSFGMNGVNPYGYGYGYAGYPIGPFVPYQWGGGVPMNLGGAAFSCRIGNFNCNFWKAPSGYYYPWMGRAMVAAPIIYVDNSQAQPKAPPLSTQFTDTFKFLDDSLKDKKISESDYASLKRRCSDIQSKFKSYQTAGGGQVDAGIEGEIRTDLDNFNKEMSERIKP